MSVDLALRKLSVVLIAAVVAIAAAAFNPPVAFAQDGGDAYTVEEGPCDVDDLPDGAYTYWTPRGQEIVHAVSYGQSLQEIANSYGFQGETAFRVLFDSNPQLHSLYLERSGITVRIPVCGASLQQRDLPEPQPSETEDDSEEQSESSESSGSGDSAEQSAEPEPEPAPAVADDSVWDQLAECESSGNWSANTGNGYYGGIQFSLPTWQSVGGSGYPHEHSREEQIKRGKILQERSGWGQWPHCAAQLGLL